MDRPKPKLEPEWWIPGEDGLSDESDRDAKVEGWNCGPFPRALLPCAVLDLLQQKAPLKQKEFIKTFPISRLPDFEIEW